MHILTKTTALSLLGLTLACGTQKDKKEESSDNQNASATEQPMITPAQPTVLPNDPVVAQTQTTSPGLDTETSYSESNTQDPWGNAYNDYQTVSYDTQYGQVAQDPRAQGYFEASHRDHQRLNQPFTRFEQQTQRPYLGQRYADHRRFLNYEQGFQHVQPGVGQWNQQRCDGMRSNFNQSRVWINRTSFNIMLETMRVFQQRGFSSSRQLERLLREAIRQRQHGRAVTLHDQLLDEFRNHPQQRRQHGQRQAPHRPSPRQRF